MNTKGAILVTSLAALAIMITAFTRDKCRTAEVTLPSGTKIQAEIARTPLEQAKGLSNRDSLASNTGMLFLFTDESIHPFWMKNTRIPLDIIWLKNNQVVETTTLEPETTNAIPSHTPTEAADAVLELNQGSLQTHAITKGATITWSECQ